MGLFAKCQESRKEGRQKLEVELDLRCLIKWVQKASRCLEVMIKDRLREGKSGGHEAKIDVDV